VLVDSGGSAAREVACAARAVTALIRAGVPPAAIGVTASLSLWISLLLLACYAFTVPADSGALTSGVTTAADPGVRGAPLALHSMVGFGLSALGGWAVGVAIDAAGGPDSHQGWRAAFLVMAAGILLGPLALRWSTRRKA